MTDEEKRDDAGRLVMTLIERFKAWRYKRAIKKLRGHFAALGYNLDLLTDEEIEAGLQSIADAMSQIGVGMREIADSCGKARQYFADNPQVLTSVDDSPRDIATKVVKEINRSEQRSAGNGLTVSDPHTKGVSDDRRR